MALFIRRPFLAVAAIGAMIGLALFPRFASADRSLGLRGDYASSGLAVDGVSLGVIARFTADGHGNITDGFQAVCFGGPPTDCHHTSFTCTYTVAPNGFGSMTCEHHGIESPADDTTGTHEFVLADGGNEFSILIDEPGAVIHGKRQ